MSYLGLDDAAVLDVAAALEQQLAPLQHAHSAISSHASGLGASGFGRRLESLIGDVARVLPVLRTIENDVASMVAKLRAQVESQQRHSGGLPQGLSGWISGAFAAAGGTALLAGGSRAWSMVEKVSTGAGWAEKVSGGLESLPKNMKLGSHYSAMWRSLIKLDNGHDFFKYKKSPVLKMLYANGELNRVSSFLEKTHATKILGTVGNVGTVMDTGKAVFQADDALSKGDWFGAFSHGADATADVLKASKNPVTYLVGLNMSLYKKDAELAAQVDWKAGLPNPFSGDNLKTVYLAEAKDLPGQLWNNLKDVF